MNLSPGSAGPQVRDLQQKLLAAGFDPLGEDGVFGVDTEAAVKRLQSAHGLPVTGTVDDATWAAINLGSDTVPDDAITLATEFEGFRSAPYKDPGRGIWTFGYGSTRDLHGAPVTANTPPITEAEARNLMRRDMTSAAMTVAQDVKVPLNDNERAAIDDFIYNVGEGNFAGSTLLRLLNAGELNAAADELLKWDRAGGAVLAGLYRRRAAERAEFDKPQGTTT